MNKESAQNDKLIILGKVNGFYGVKGWVKLFSHTEPKENIVNYGQVLLFIKGQWQNFEINNGRLQGKGVVVHFKGYDDRESAQALLGADVAINRAQMVRLDQNDFYWVDLIGLQVINNEEVVLGMVTDMMETGANDVLVVKAKDAQAAGLNAEYLIPYVPVQFILDINLETGIIRVDWDKDF